MRMRNHLPEFQTTHDHRGKGPRNYRRTDARIHEDVCDHLLVDGSVDATDLDVIVKDGVVILEGSVPERAMKRYAEDIALEIPGVNDVENRIRWRRDLLTPPSDVESRDDLP